ncbi:TetR/AcrR family transcriptional regulator [Shewanella cyperi]|uniref:TetR/AcrR family transcriptional regulator n=1 Tax=Shewanella cyperi TaxID=2814292 RepID=UPI001A95430B|nr:TetR/AcrR family transcriptional regulator [Shewanella cyperi]QSX39732.1 TetR/AcrR family transcriptional regulator [Shewanella cyperi]
MAAKEAPMSRSEQKRAQILEAAIALFCGQGFPNTSMDEVAKKAGVSKQTVYAHFGSKDDLFVASIESKCVVYQLTDVLLADAAQPEKALTLFAVHFGELIVSDDAITVYRACVSQVESHPDTAQLYFDAGPEHMLGLLVEFFTRVETHGRYSFGNKRQAAIRFCLMLFGELRLRKELGLDTGELEQEHRQYCIQSAELFLRAHRLD